MNFFWQFVTDLGDSAVTLPLAALTVAFLLLSRWPRAGLALLAAVTAAAFAIAGLKLALGSCGRNLLQATLVNPSGHAALSTVVYGALALLLGSAVQGWRRSAVHAGFALSLGGIALSRVALQAHTPEEVLAGLAVGLVALTLFYSLLGAAPPRRLKVSQLAVCALLLLAIMHGVRWPIEERIREMVALIEAGVPQCA